MASFMTNRGKFRMFNGYFRAVAIPVNFNIMLFNDTTTPTVDTNTVADLTEIPAGNGYTTGGISVARNATDFDVLNEDDTLNEALLQILDIVWTAAGGPLPVSGTGARWAGLVDDNVTINSRDIVAVFDLVSNRSVSDTQTLTLADCEIQVEDAA